MSCLPGNPLFSSRRLQLPLPSRLAVVGRVRRRRRLTPALPLASASAAPVAEAPPAPAPEPAPAPTPAALLRPRPSPLPPRPAPPEPATAEPAPAKAGEEGPCQEEEVSALRLASLRRLRVAIATFHWSTERLVRSVLWCHA